MIIAMIVCSIGAVACGTKEPVEQKSPLTPGMAKKHIYPGKTTQIDVMEIFGPPDLVSHKHGKEVWTYDKISHEMRARQGFLTILIAGRTTQQRTQSTRSIMLIIYFDEDETVKDYRLSAARY